MSETLSRHCLSTKVKYRRFLFLFVFIISNKPTFFFLDKRNRYLFKKTPPPLVELRDTVTTNYYYIGCYVLAYRIQAIDHPSPLSVRRVVMIARTRNHTVIITRQF